MKKKMLIIYIMVVVVFLLLLAYETIFKNSFLPKDYSDSIHLINKSISNCLAMTDSTIIQHKIDGDYIFVMNCKTDNVHNDYLKYISERGTKDIDLQIIDSIENISANILNKRNMELNALIVKGNKTLLNKIKDKFQFYAWDKDAQEIKLMVYNVPKDVPKNEDVVLKYTFKGCNDSVFAKLGEVTIHLQKISTKW